MKIEFKTETPKTAVNAYVERVRQGQLPPRTNPVGAKDWHAMPCPFVNLFCSDDVLALFDKEDEELFAIQAAQVMATLHDVIKTKKMTGAKGSFVVEFTREDGRTESVTLKAQIHATWELRTCLVLMTPDESIHE